MKNNILNREDGVGSFNVLLASLSVLLLSFFIVLNAISVRDEARVRKTFQSVKEGFNFSFMPGGYIAMQGMGDKIDLPGVPMVNISDQLRELTDKMEKRFFEGGLGEDINIISSTRGLVVTLSDKVLFESSDATLKDNLMLSEIAKIVKDVPNSVQIEGHTDDTPIDKKYPSNWELSVDRAYSVLKYFVEQEGIKPERLSIAGYADTRPIFINPEDKWRNRRVEITLLN